MKRQLSLVLGLLLLAGCASDPLTFSQDFKRDGLRQYNSGDYVQAAGSFKAAAKQDPTDYQTQYYLGLSYERTGDPEQAVEAYKLCLKLRTQMPSGRADIATREKVLSRLAGLIARGDFAEAEINGIQNVAQTQQSAEDYRLLARIFALRGDAESAVDSYRRALSFAGGDFILTKEYGLYLLKINQTQEGTRVLKIAWHLEPTDRQVAATLRQLGVNESDFFVNSTSIEQQASASSPPQTAWDADTAPRD